MKAPTFWYRPVGFIAAVLSPLSILYRFGSGLHRAFTTTKSIDIPVICVGNVTIGGAGKTPCVAAIAKLLQQKGFAVHILSRGYGGSEVGPLRVDQKKHSALQVGDEPLILANVAPTWVSKNRYEGAKAIYAAGADVILMDDGLQNNTLRKDIRIVVVDQKLGFGNCMVLPAGPLREPLNDGIDKADIILLTNPQENHSFYQPTYAVTTHMIQSDLDPLMGKKIVAFSGIAHPQKFYESLKAMKLDVIGTQDFADHHVFTEDELESLMRYAENANAMLVTTEKDWMRLTPTWRKRIHMIHIENEIQDAEKFFKQLQPSLKRVAA
jgi:tetraacyldisaccharide 4'-kinase